jgi:hypothetical protein
MAALPVFARVNCRHAAKVGRLSAAAPRSVDGRERPTTNPQSSAEDDDDKFSTDQANIDSRGAEQWNPMDL